MSASLEGGASIAHDRYADQLICEFLRRKACTAQHEITSIFFGGGTPSLFDSSCVARVIERLLTETGTSGNTVEITVECNPCSFDRQKAVELRAAGVNRISLGIQSLNDDSLRFLGRRHDSRHGLDALAIALGAGFHSVSADLLLGLPQQTTKDELEQARLLAESGISHLSAYALTIEAATPFGKRRQQGTLPLAPDERIADTFVAFHEMLEQLGFEHYEISNYARQGYRSRHNMQYWQGAPYLGLGVAAFGTVSVNGQKLRYRNPTRIDRYLSFNYDDPKQSPFEVEPEGLLEERELLDTEMLVSERIMLGLRLREGLDLAALSDEFGVPILTQSRASAVERHIARGNLVFTGDRICIKPQAWLHSDSIIADLA